YGYAAQISSSVATGYRNGVVEEPLVSLDLFSGAGGAVSTAHDLALWDEALLAGTLLSKSYLDDVWRDGVPTGQGDGRYAMGWSLTHLGGHRELWHNGLAPGAGGYCFNAVFPDDALAIAVLTNGFGAEGLPERMTRQIAAAYGIGSPPPAPAASSATPSAAPNDNAAADALARAFWDGLASGTIDRSKLTPEFSTALTPVLLGQVKQGIALFGTLQSFTFVGTTAGQGGTIYRYSLVFAGGAVHEWDVAFTTDMKIAGSRLVS
ncbi:MAG: serine hydrolase, partial [Candidatus Tumulicola sp.]